MSGTTPPVALTEEQCGNKADLKSTATREQVIACKDSGWITDSDFNEVIQEQAVAEFASFQDELANDKIIPAAEGLLGDLDKLKATDTNRGEIWELCNILAKSLGDSGRQKGRATGMTEAELSDYLFENFGYGTIPTGDRAFDYGNPSADGLSRGTLEDTAAATPLAPPSMEKPTLGFTPEDIYGGIYGMAVHSLNPLARVAESLHKGQENFHQMGGVYGKENDKGVSSYNPEYNMTYQHYRKESVTDLLVNLGYPPDWYNLSDLVKNLDALGAEGARLGFGFDYVGMPEDPVAVELSAVVDAAADRGITDDISDWPEFGAVGYPWLWANTLAIALGQLRTLATERDFATHRTGIGGSFCQEAIDNLRSGQKSKGLQHILHWNHGADKGVFGWDGTPTSTPVQNCDKCVAAHDGAPSHGWRPYNAFYHNRGNQFNDDANWEAAQIRPAGGTYNVEAVTLARQYAGGHFNQTFPDNPYCRNSINGILESGGPYMQAIDIGWMDLDNPEFGRSHSETLGTGRTYTAFGGHVEYYFGATSVKHDGHGHGQAQQHVGPQDQGVWSLYANGSRLIAMSQQMRSYNTFLAGALLMIGTRIKSRASAMKQNSDKIYSAHMEMVKKACELKQTLSDEEIAYDDGFWRSGADADEHDMLVSEAQAAIDLARFNLENILYRSDKQAIMFKEQCFLLSFITKIAAYKRDILDSVYFDAPPIPSSDPVANNYAGRYIEASRDQSKITKRLPYHTSSVNLEPELSANATILLDGDPYGFLNLLTINPSQASLFNAKPSEISSLQPYIRLYKIEFKENEDGSIFEQETEIHFDSHFSQHEMAVFRNRKTRGVGAGIKSFNFTYDGSNPFAVKKSIKANLKIFANSFKELSRPRWPGGIFYQTPTVNQIRDSYSYLDLALKTWNAQDINAEECEPAMTATGENIANSQLNFRLKAVVGLSVPPNEMSSMNRATREALRESFVTLQLTPTVHNFEFDELGRVVFNLNYLAYIEEFFDSKMFNVFANSATTKDRYTREFRMNTYRTACNSQKVDQQKQDYAKVARSQTAVEISSLMSSMIQNDRIFYIDIPYTTVKSFLTKGPYADYGVTGNAVTPRRTESQNEILEQQINDAMGEFDAAASSSGDPIDDDVTRRRVAAALVGANPETTSLSYFYLSDLIDMILANIEKELGELVEGGLDEIENMSDVACGDVRKRSQELKSANIAFRKLRILLGPIEFVHPEARAGKKSMVANLGDLPISVKYFVEWLTSTMLSKEETFYPLTKFLNDLINNLVRNFLNNDTCFGYNIKQKARLQQSAVTGFGNHLVLDPISEHLADTNIPVAQKRYEVKRGMLDTTNLAAEVADPDVAGTLDTVAFTDLNTPNVAFRGHMNDFVISQNLPVLNPSGPPNSARTNAPMEKAYNYLIYFVGRTMPFENMLGDKFLDEQRGIFHYKIGRHNGIVKNIKLTKTETKGLAEVRFEQDGYDGLQQLRVIYDAQIDTFSNVNTFPGTYVFIDPAGFDPSMPGGVRATDGFGLTKLGIGGYYMIVRSEHEFGPGRANTILHTKWVNQIDNYADEVGDSTAGAIGDGDPLPGRCTVELREDPEEETEADSGMFGFLGGMFGD